MAVKAAECGFGIYIQIHSAMDNKEDKIQCAKWVQREKVERECTLIKNLIFGFLQEGVTVQ